MEATTRRFGRRELIRLIAPMLVEQILLVTVGIFATIMVANAGESAVSGVSLVEAINMLALNLFSSLAAGGAIVAGQYLGKDEKPNAKHAARQLVVSITLLAAATSAVCLLLNRQILSFFYGQIEPDVMRSARDYFYFSAMSFPFIALFNAAAALFRGMNKSGVSMLNALIMNVINVAGNVAFIHYMHLGAMGAGLATLAARAVAAVSMLWMLRNPDLAISVRSYSPRGLDGKMIRRILKIGVPGSLENCSFMLGRIILTSLIATMGTTAIAANAVGFSVATFAVAPGMAMGMAMMAVIAQCVGANEYEQAHCYIKYLLTFAFVIMIVANGAILAFNGPILSLYKTSAETTRLAWYTVLLHSGAAVTIWPLAFTLSNAFRAAGDVRFPMAVSIFSMFVFRIGCSYLLENLFGLGVLSVWIAMLIDWAVRAVFFTWRWRSGRWRRFQVI